MNDPNSNPHNALDLQTEWDLLLTNGPNTTGEIIDPQQERLKNIKERLFNSAIPRSDDENLYEKISDFNHTADDEHIVFGDFVTEFPDIDTEKPKQRVLINILDGNTMYQLKDNDEGIVAIYEAPTHDVFKQMINPESGLPANNPIDITRVDLVHLFSYLPVVDENNLIKNISAADKPLTEDLPDGADWDSDFEEILNKPHDDKLERFCNVLEKILSQPAASAR